jgi:hypothetical protein
MTFDSVMGRGSYPPSGDMSTVAILERLVGFDTSNPPGHKSGAAVHADIARSLRQP